MVRMTDLVRGGSTPARPSAPPEKPRPAAPPAPPPAPPAKEAPEAPPPRIPRLNLRALANSGPVRPTPPAKPARPRAEPVDVDEVFSGILLVLERVRDLVKSSEPFPWAELERAVERAVSSLRQSADLFWVASHPTPPPGTDPLAFHQARVAVLALRIGASIGLDGARLVELGMTGCLFDVGLWALAESGRRADPQSAEYRTHPRAGADLVRRWGPPGDRLAEAIQQHHELEQGQGYPQGLRGTVIHPHAKILGLLDRYAALTGSGSARGRSRPHEAIRDIVRSKGDEFSPALIKALLGEVSVFPPGTPVRLNTGEVARVIGVNRHHPLRPRVEVVADAKGQALAARIIDLVESPFVYVTGPATESA